MRQEGASFAVWVMNADGIGQSRLTAASAGTVELWPAWSPDGSRIAFASDMDGDFDIYSVAADGTGLARLTDEPGMEFAPAWSPDGDRIAYKHDPGGSPVGYSLLVPTGHELFFALDGPAPSAVKVMDADGSRRTVLTALTD